MNADEISRRAEKELRKQRRKGRRKKFRWPKKRPPKPMSAYSPESWHIYHKVYPYGMNTFVWVFIVLTLSICLFVVYYIEKNAWLLYAGCAIAGIFLLRLAAHWIIKLSRFGTFKSWRKTLPFQFNGWESVWSKNEFDSYKQWYGHVTITVVIKAENEKLRKAIHDALFLYVSEANKCFYEKNFSQAGYGGELRKKWVLTEKLHAFGSANYSVMGEAYILVNRYLRAIHNEFGGIHSVTIATEGNIYTVDPIEISSD